MPAAEEELLLTDAQQAGHQRIQGLEWREKTRRDTFTSGTSHCSFNEFKCNINYFPHQIYLNYSAYYFEHVRE